MDETEMARKAAMTAAEYMRAGVEVIDERFGAGYAQAHPELLAAFMQSAALDFGAVLLARRVDQAAAHIAEALLEQKP